MGLLNWNSGQHFDHGGDCPCTQCGKPTPLRSHDGEPVHKVCAEDWNDRNPAAPRHQHEGHDLGTARYHSDPPRKSRKDGAR
ncbi:hypothetical protein O1Q96_07895 [Streptomyces sp. Qhu-G9]|uniref:hypothetical protein n=1 Tax=Streptomyces sp. Qhu-G9 TaxID=3452799 RepID=UPI0022AC3C1F|nr:hypothetical protein [Streptomyces aurantiacus]WAU79672.1 hypothetical protein O1Q96_07895 [Streptomyces aurantiacus]